MNDVTGRTQSVSINPFEVSSVPGPLDDTFDEPRKVVSLLMDGAELTDVATCRVIAATVLRGEGESVCATAALLVSEAVTNTLIHNDIPYGNLDARSPSGLRNPHPFFMDVEIWAEVITVRITGPGSAADDITAPAVPDLDAESGRGLCILSALADRWATHGDGESRTVWFDLKRGPVPVA